MRLAEWQRVRGFAVSVPASPALLAVEGEAGAGKSTLWRAGVAAAFRKLADAGINVDLLLPVRISDDLFFAVICVDDEATARAVLGDHVVPE